MQYFLFYLKGKNESAPLIKQTCCGIGDTVPFTVQSTDGDMYVLFQTDNTVAREGFRISYILEGAPTTTASVTISKQFFSQFKLCPCHSYTDSISTLFYMLIIK